MAVDKKELLKKFQAMLAADDVIENGKVFLLGQALISKINPKLTVTSVEEMQKHFSMFVNDPKFNDVDFCETLVTLKPKHFEVLPYPILSDIFESSAFITLSKNKQNALFKFVCENKIINKDKNKDKTSDAEFVLNKEHIDRIINAVPTYLSKASDKRIADARAFVDKQIQEFDDKYVKNANPDLLKKGVNQKSIGGIGGPESFYSPRSRYIDQIRATYIALLGEDHKKEAIDMADADAHLINSQSKVVQKNFMTEQCVNLCNMRVAAVFQRLGYNIDEHPQALINIDRPVKNTKQENLKGAAQFGVKLLTTFGHVAGRSAGMRLISKIPVIGQYLGCAIPIVETVVKTHNRLENARREAVERGDYLRLKDKAKIAWDGVTEIAPMAATMLLTSALAAAGPAGMIAAGFVGAGLAGIRTTHRDLKEKTAQWDKETTKGTKAKDISIAALKGTLMGSVFYAGAAVGTSAVDATIDSAVAEQNGGDGAEAFKKSFGSSLRHKFFLDRHQKSNLKLSDAEEKATAKLKTQSINRDSSLTKGAGTTDAEVIAKAQYGEPPAPQSPLTQGAGTTDAEIIAKAQYGNPWQPAPTMQTMPDDTVALDGMTTDGTNLVDSTMSTDGGVTSTDGGVTANGGVATDGNTSAAGNDQAVSAGQTADTDKTATETTPAAPKINIDQDTLQKLQKHEYELEPRARATMDLSTKHMHQLNPETGKYEQSDWATQQEIDAAARTLRAAGVEDTDGALRNLLGAGQFKGGVYSQTFQNLVDGHMDTNDANIVLKSDDILDPSGDLIRDVAPAQPEPQPETKPVVESKPVVKAETPASEQPKVAAEKISKLEAKYEGSVNLQAKNGMTDETAMRMGAARGALNTVKVQGENNLAIPQRATDYEPITAEKLDALDAEYQNSWEIQTNHGMTDETAMQMGAGRGALNTLQAQSATQGANNLGIPERAMDYKPYSAAQINQLENDLHNTIHELTAAGKLDADLGRQLGAAQGTLNTYRAQMGYTTQQSTDNVIDRFTENGTEYEVVQSAKGSFVREVPIDKNLLRVHTQPEPELER